MATVALTNNEVIQMTPVLKRRLSCTGGTTAAALTHGESRSPDEVYVVVTDGSNPSQTGVGVERATSATTMTVDCVVDAAETFDIICTWYSQASDGITAPTVTA